MITQINTGFFNVLKLWPETAATATPYVAGDVVKSTSYNSHSYKCTIAGTTGTTAPTWGTVNAGTTADGSVVWTCYDPKTYQVKAPQGSTVPYVAFGLETEVPIGTFADFEAVESLTFWVNTFSDKSTADVAEIADEVMDALDDITVTATGYTNMKCVREFTGTIIWDIETGIYQVPMRYRVWLDKT